MKDKYIRVAVMGLVGATIYIVSFYIESVKILLQSTGGILIGTSMVDALINIAFQKTLNTQINNLKDNVSNLKTNIGTLRNNVSTLQDTVAIASGAVESGLTAVFANREVCLQTIKFKLEKLLDELEGKTIERSLTNPKEASQDEKASPEGEPIKVRMLGISLGDFLCPHGFLQSVFRRMLKLKEFDIQVIILEDGGLAAYQRAIHEEFGKFPEVKRDTDIFEKINISDPTLQEHYKTTKCHDELKTATDYLRDLVNRKIIDRDLPHKDQNVNAKLETYTYKCSPMAFLFIMDDDMFIENYHFAGRGGEAPILRVSKYKKQSHSEESKLYQIFFGHFKAVRSMSKKMIPNANPKNIPDPKNEDDSDEEQSNDS